MGIAGVVRLRFAALMNGTVLAPKYVVKSIDQIGLGSFLDYECPYSRC